MNKKYIFEAPEDDYARLKVRLKYDNLKQGEFFRLVLRSYLDRDKEMVTLIKNYKISNRKMGLSNIKRASKDCTTGATLLEDLGITSSEVESIFDIIERKE